MSSESLMERLSAADPAISASPDRDTAEAVLQQVLSAGDEPPASAPARRPTSSGTRFGFGPRPTEAARRHRKRWAMVGAVAVATSVALLVVGTTGGGPSPALAGWTPSPTHPAAGQLHAAESACASKPSLARLTATLIDTRGPYSAFLYLQARTATICLAGPGLIRANPKQGPIIVKDGAPGNGAVRIPGPHPSPPPPGRISAHSPMVTSLTTMAEFGIIVGHAGRGVTGVRLALDDGSTVTATVKNGWFAAWWPSAAGVTSADVTTATGTTTEPLSLPKPRHCKLVHRILSQCKPR